MADRTPEPVVCVAPLTLFSLLLAIILSMIVNFHAEPSGLS